mgnify:CR=1 FL=1
MAISVCDKEKLCTEEENCPKTALSLCLAHGWWGHRKLPRAPQSRVSISCGYCSIVSKSYPKAVCITTGGQGKDEPQSEGEAAKEALMKFGVAPKRIFAEVNSKTTLENLRFARDILRENGFSDTVLLATQSYHQWRACRMAKMLGLTPYPLHAKTNLKSLPKNLCREFLAILKFLLFTRKE